MKKCNQGDNFFVYYMKKFGSNPKCDHDRIKKIIEYELKRIEKIWKKSDLTKNVIPKTTM